MGVQPNGSGGARALRFKPGAGSAGLALIWRPYVGGVRARPMPGIGDRCLVQAWRWLGRAGFDLASVRGWCPVEAYAAQA